MQIYLQHSAFRSHFTAVLFAYVLGFLLLFCFRFVLYCSVLFCIVLYCIVLFCIVLFCFVLYCIVLFCFVLFCFVLFCFVLFFACSVWTRGVGGLPLRWRSLASRRLKSSLFSSAAPCSSLAPAIFASCCSRPRKMPPRPLRAQCGCSPWLCPGVEDVTSGGILFFAVSVLPSGNFFCSFFLVNL